MEKKANVFIVAACICIIGAGFVYMATQEANKRKADAQKTIDSTKAFTNELMVGTCQVYFLNYGNQKYIVSPNCNVGAVK